MIYKHYPTIKKIPTLAYLDNHTYNLKYLFKKLPELIVTSCPANGGALWGQSSGFDHFLKIAGLQ